MAERYLSWLDERAGELSLENGSAETLLSDMAWTAAVGRSHFAHRAGVVFEDAASLREELRALAETCSKPRRMAAFAGEDGDPVDVGEGLQESEPGERSYVEAVARAYETGLAIDFAGLFAGEQRRRISLPGYPFQRQRFWFEAS